MPTRWSTFSVFLVLALSLASCAALGGGGKDKLELELRYDERSQRLHVLVTRNLHQGETLHARVRQGGVGELDCGAMKGSLERIDGRAVRGPAPANFAGPVLDESVFDNRYDTSWLRQEPTPEMLASIEEGSHVVDLCLMDGGSVVLQREMDVRRALDRAGSNGKFDGDEEERIRSTVAYAEACVSQLGEIPFFEPIDEGDYGTFNCLDAVPIPTTVTGDDGTVEHPETEVDQCDRPQYIYDLCEPNAVDGRTNGPRVTSAKNEQGSHWVLLCRKAKETEGQYNDVAMIGHNPYTGKTCYFQNALYERTDGEHVPHPGDKVDSDRSPQQSESLWEGIHGGLGSGIECAECHSNDPFIHTPWIDQARDEEGRPVVPKMDVHDDFEIGFNESPYTIVNTTGQGWRMPKQLVSEEASACTKCHRIGNERWTKDWIDRLDGSDSAWTNITTPAYRSFEHTFWMPPDLEGVTEATWDDSEYGRALAFIKRCGDDPNAEECVWEDLPDAQIVDPGEPPEVELEGSDLALASLKILGADVRDPSDPHCGDGSCATRRCAECHSVSRAGLRHWRDLTQQAWTGCGLQTDPETMSPEEARESVDCLRAAPEDPQSVFAAEKLGVLTTGVQYGHFRQLFRKAYGEEHWLPEYLRFRARVEMPKGSHPSLSQLEYETLKKWFHEDLTNMDDHLRAPPPPDSCEDFRSDALAEHIDHMHYDGWEAVNQENGIRMFGCSSGNDAMQCFTGGGYPDRSGQWGNGHGVVRELTELGFRTSFWTRTSADGRYVGNGGGEHGATITDLRDGRDIGVDASYDPGFFPDNSGFIFQGGGAGICAQSVLEGHDVVTFEEPECIRARGINLYQHVARGLNGGDYFIINSQFTSDSGSASSNPRASFSANSTMKFTPMVFDGTTYQPLDEVVVDSPYEGDSVLSPSGEMVVSRLAGPDGDSLGYVLRKVNAQQVGDRYRVDISEELARICVSGAKPNVSFDERFVVTHDYQDETAEVLLFDLSTGEHYQLTDMPNGSKALFPHFRSDGWIYFLVQDGSDGRFVAASDAALRLRSGSDG